MKLILNFNKLKILILIFLVNIYLLLYIAKIYEFSFVNDNVRFIIMLLLSFVIAISMFKMIAVNKKINLAFAVFLSYFFYVLIVTLMREQFNPTPLMSTLFFPIVFLASYAIFKKSKNLSIIKKYQFIMLILYGAMYLYVRLITNTNHGMVLNSIYYQVLLLPFILTLDNKYIRRIGILVIILMALFSMKRVAFIAVILSLLIYLIFKKGIGNLKRNIINKIFSISLIMLLIGVLISFFNHLLNLNMLDRIASLRDDGGSGRFNILLVIIRQLRFNTFPEHIIGNGFNATTLVANGFTAHNDFIEILYDYGLIGFILYINIYLILIRYAINFNRRNYKYSAAFNASIVIFIVISLFSHLIFIPTYIGYLSLFWSFVICDYEIDKERQKK